VTNVILAGDDDKDDDEEDFLVEEKPKDDLDLKTETSAPDNEVIFCNQSESFEKQPLCKN
jgi:hypothetical protein